MVARKHCVRAELPEGIPQELLAAHPPTKAVQPVAACQQALEPLEQANEAQVHKTTKPMPAILDR